jgi:hypothetical protein
VEQIRRGSFAPQREDLPLIPVQRQIVDDEIDTDLELPAPALELDREQAQTLSDRDASILAFEKQWWRHAGAKEQAIKDQFGLSGTRYYQLLNSLLDNPAALAHDPVLVGRLRRIRGSRARQRRQ